MTGGVIAAGDPVLDIVPAGASLIAEARVELRDVQRLRSGTAAEIRLDGVAERGGRVLRVAVAGISADRVTDSLFDKALYMPCLAFAAVGLRLSLQPGMSVTVVVATEARTASDGALARTMREE